MMDLKGGTLSNRASFLEKGGGGGTREPCVLYGWLASVSHFQNALSFKGGLLECEEAPLWCCIFAVCLMYCFTARILNATVLTCMKYAFDHDCVHMHLLV